MRRTVVVLAAVGAAGVAAALAYSAYNVQQEFDRLIAAGDAALAADRSYEAVEAYSGALALDPSSVIAHLKRGSLYRAQGETEAAARDLKEASDLDSTATLPLEELGDLDLDVGRFDRAAQRFERFIDLDDRNARVLYKLGLAHYRNSEPTAAIEPLSRALAIDPGSAEAGFLLGLSYRDLGQSEAARAALEAAVKVAPAQPVVREALARVYGDLGQVSKAVDQLEAVAALDPGRPAPLVAVGLTQADAGRLDAAIVTLGRAVERFPASSTVFAALGRVWLTIARERRDRVALGKALEALTEASTHSDIGSDTLTDLGRALLLNDDVSGAERAFRQAVSRLPVVPDAYLQLADTALRQGRTQEGRDALLQYAALVGDREPLAPVATRIADLSAKLGEPALAARWFDRVIDEVGPSPSMLGRLATAAWDSGDVARARQAAAEALRLAPGDRALAAINRRVQSDPARP